MLSDSLSATPQRIVGLDIARALAVFGMLSAHVGPKDLAGLGGWFFTLPQGRASLLFALLAGIGVSLMAKSTSGNFREKMLWRALILLILGLTLQMPDHGIAVIIQHYAVLFLLGIWMTNASSRTLWFLAVSGMTIGSLIFLHGKMLLPEYFNRHPVAFGDPLWQIPLRLMVTGAYPVITWITPFAAGILIARLDLRSDEVQKRLMRWGFAMFAGSIVVSLGLEIALNYPSNQNYHQLIYIRPHDQLPLWLMEGIGAAILVLGLALLVGTHWPFHTRLLADCGRFALSLYTLQLLAFALAATHLKANSLATGLLHTVGLILASFLLTWVIRKFFSNGPIELLLRPPPNFTR